MRKANDGFLVFAALAALFLAPARAFAQIYVSTGPASGLRLYYPNSNDWWLDPSHGRLDVRVNGGAAPSVSVSSSGSVGIGTTAPGAKLDVEGASGSTYAIVASSGIQILSNGIVFPDNTILTSTASLSGGGLNTSHVSLFTSNGTWIQPSGVTTVYVTLCGGGGGGGGINSSGESGGGGGSGYFYINYPVTVSGNVSVTVGSAGAGTAINTTGSNGGSGTASSFGSLSVAGGSGGQYSSSAEGGGNGGNGGEGGGGGGCLGTSATTCYSGASSGTGGNGAQSGTGSNAGSGAVPNGGSGFAGTYSAAYGTGYYWGGGGGGGGSPLGIGGNGAYGAGGYGGNTLPGSGTGYCAGGGGAIINGGGSTISGSGAPGVVIVQW